MYGPSGKEWGCFLVVVGICGFGIISVALRVIGYFWRHVTVGWQ